MTTSDDCLGIKEVGIYSDLSLLLSDLTDTVACRTRPICLRVTLSPLPPSDSMPIWFLGICPGILQVTVTSPRLER